MTGMDLSHAFLQSAWESSDDAGVLFIFADWLDERRSRPQEQVLTFFTCSTTAGETRGKQTESKRCRFTASLASPSRPSSPTRSI